MRRLVERAALLAAALLTLRLLPSAWRPRVSIPEARARGPTIEAALAAREPARALALLRPLLRFYPDNAEYVRQEARALRLAGDAAGEARAWERFLSLAGPPAQACPDVGEAYERAGRAEDAFQAHLRCWGLAPWEPRVLSALARALERRGWRAEAARLEALARSARR